MAKDRRLGPDFRGGFHRLTTAICKWSTPPRSAFISTPPTSKRGSTGKRQHRLWGPVWNPMHGALAGRADHQDPRPRRRQRLIRSRSSSPKAKPMTAGAPPTCSTPSAPAKSLLADRAYDSDALRKTLADRGAWANIKPMPQSRQYPRLQPLPLSLPQPRRALLQQAQALQSHRHPLRKTRRQLSRPRQTRLGSNLDAIYESVT